MSQNLLKIQLHHLKELYDQLPHDLEQTLPAVRKKDVFHFKAFGEPCSLYAKGITLGGETLTGPKGVFISLYARNARKEVIQLKPLKSFKQMKGSMPYEAAFTAYSEKALVPYVTQIRRCKERIIEIFDGHENKDVKEDFSFTLHPLPKVPLYYVFYFADEEFPASVRCLFAANAELFMPVGGLADVAEYTGKKIIEIVVSNCSAE